MKIGIASDHAGFDMKEYVKDNLVKEGYDVIDYGPDVKKSVDYPDYAAKVAEAVGDKKIERGILVCGTGIGMSISANKFPFVRAAVANSKSLAQLAREHNNANVLALGGRLIARELAVEIARIFLETPFLRGRHLRRVNKIRKLEQTQK